MPKEQVASLQPQSQWTLHRHLMYNHYGACEDGGRGQPVQNCHGSKQVKEVARSCAHGAV